jgi:hypothetical protein
LAENRNTGELAVYLRFIKKTPTDMVAALCENAHCSCDSMMDDNENIADHP